MFKASVCCTSGYFNLFCFHRYFFSLSGYSVCIYHIFETSVKNRTKEKVKMISWFQKTHHLELVDEKNCVKATKVHELHEKHISQNTVVEHLFLYDLFQKVVARN